MGHSCTLLNTNALTMADPLAAVCDATHAESTKQERVMLAGQLLIIIALNWRRGKSATSANNWEQLTTELTKTGKKDRERKSWRGRDLVSVLNIRHACGSLDTHTHIVTLVSESLSIETESYVIIWLWHRWPENNSMTFCSFAHGTQTALIAFDAFFWLRLTSFHYRSVIQYVRWRERMMQSDAEYAVPTNCSKGIQGRLCLLCVSREGAERKRRHQM